MKTTTSNITRLALTALSVVCLGASAMAGPGPMYYINVNGQMMVVTPLAKDKMLKNGCKICTNGAVVYPNGKTMRLKEGDMVSAEGTRVKPSQSSHGG